jgi:hypothetical protein
LSRSPRHWTTPLISQVLCGCLFLQSILLSAGTLPRRPERQVWVSAEQRALAQDVHAGSLAQESTPEPVEPPAAPASEDEEAPQPPEPNRLIPDVRLLTDSPDEVLPPGKPEADKAQKAAAVPAPIPSNELPPFLPTL